MFSPLIKNSFFERLQKELLGITLVIFTVEWFAGHYCAEVDLLIIDNQ